MENSEKKMLTTEDLNRTLGKKELYSIAFGHVIGSGVFSLIGIGIGITGKSAWIGILLSAVFIVLQALPFIVMAGTARFRGGYYSMMGTLWGPKFAGFYIVIFCVQRLPGHVCHQLCPISPRCAASGAYCPGGGGLPDRVFCHQPAGD